MEEKLILSTRKIRKICMMNHSVEHAWWLWTTEQGLRKVFGANCKMELRPFGPFEIYFDETEPKGRQGSEGCQILSYLPGEMISFTWNAPVDFEYVRNHAYKTWIVIQFEKVKSDYTAVTLTHTGWPEGEVWDRAYEYFDKAWSRVLKQMELAKADSINPSSFFIKGTDGSIIEID